MPPLFRATGEGVAGLAVLGLSIIEVGVIAQALSNKHVIASNKRTLDCLENIMAADTLLPNLLSPDILVPVLLMIIFIMDTSVCNLFCFLSNYYICESFASI
jgi:hypothetical protein